MLTALSVDLVTRFVEGYAATDGLFQILNPGVLYERPIPERHRIVFYVGHLEAFDWNLLRGHLKRQSFNPAFDRLFAFGIDPVDGGLPADRPEDWPSLSEISAYRSRIRQELGAALRDAADSDELARLTNIAIEHRLMHAETLEYMFHQLPYGAKTCPAARRAVVALAGTTETAEVSAGETTLGLKRDCGEFGWDNEFEAHTVAVPRFSIGRHKVSNGRFKDFVEDGGYRRSELWTKADWDWLRKEEIAHPVFWIPAQSGFRHRGMFEEEPLNLHAPVYVSHAEAAAYARWGGKELPSEAEWQRALEDSPHNGVAGLLGTGWEWTSSVFAPFPGFQIMPSYPGYSADFFDGKHFVMKGGSPSTAPCLLRKSFRNWFQAHYQYVYAGFRCVKH